MKLNDEVRQELRAIMCRIETEHPNATGGGKWLLLVAEIRNDEVLMNVLLGDIRDALK